MDNLLNIPQHLTDTEVMSAFGEQAKVIVPALLEELIAKRYTLVQRIGDTLALINAQSSDEVFRYFWKLWLTLNEGADLQELDRKLFRLYRLKNRMDGKPLQSTALSEDSIEAARAVPITDIIGEPVRRSGKDYLSFCPLHDDHNPSMRVYLEQNRAWCYVCNAGGDSIKLYGLTHGCDFKTAVLELTGSAS